MYSITAPVSTLSRSDSEIVTTVPFGSLVASFLTSHSRGMSSPADASMAARVRRTTLRSPFRTVVILRTLAIPKAALFPVPNLPRPGVPARRSRFSPCMVK